LFMGSLLCHLKDIRLQLSAVYQRCNSGQRDNDFIEFLRRHLPLSFPAVPPKADIELRELNVRQGPIADMGTLFDQLIGAQQPVWFIDLAVLRLIDSLNVLGAAQSANSVGLAPCNLGIKWTWCRALDWRLLFDNPGVPTKHFPDLWQRESGL